MLGVPGRSRGTARLRLRHVTAGAHGTGGGSGARPDTLAGTGAATAEGCLPGVMRTPARTPARRGRTGSAVAIVVALVAWLAACSDGDDGTAAPPASQPAAGSAPEDPGDTDPKAPPEPTSEGCEPTDGGPPSGVEPHEIVDVDGDGEKDSAWLTGGSERELGITTASGSTFSVTLDAASPERASAVVDVVATEDGTAPIALVDTGRAVRLYSVADCGLTPTQNPEGEPYTFDKGFTGEGTGVECVDDGEALEVEGESGERHLAGVNAEPSDDGALFTVTRTLIDLSAGATAASNGIEETVVEGAPADDETVKQAQRTSCGDLVAGEDGPVEPES